MGQATYPGARHGASGRSADMAAAAEHVRQAATAEAIELGDSMRTLGAEVDRALRAALRAQPTATLAVFAAVGFVLGAIWKR